MGSPRAWGWAALAALALAVLSLLSNITTTAQLEGRADGLLTVRLTLSVLANAGIVWGGLMVLAGWLVAPPLRAALVAGPAAGVLGLAAHYGLGGLTGLMPWESFRDNVPWFVVAAVLGVPLGAVGALARRTDVLGLVARMVVPLGAILEPVVRGWWVPDAGLGAPTVHALQISTGVLVLAGLAGLVLVVRRWPDRGPGQSSTGGIGLVR